ncbi:ABC transporter permease/substrate-binding protein [Lewinella cohaerens]|uniref:ABC transporter permease/substrate-binding protein n=1 Tax=Lewinella cohaerens TaxID=70995 RepID=UPI0003811C5C|nr:ABC transporter permease/substrate-binding protein [Lewinella cohaerens]
MNFLIFLEENSDKLLELSFEHLGLTLLSILLACVIAIPTGIWIARRNAWSRWVLGGAGILQTIPSIALLGSLIPLLGIGVKPAIFALLLYAILPILRNTFTGLQGVDPVVREAAAGMGMTKWQILQQVELPLALPVILAGVRTAAVINVGVATLAAYIGAGGLGEFIFGGIALNNNQMILAGAIPAAGLAILFDQGLALLSKKRKQQPSALLLLIPILGWMAWRGPANTELLSAAFDPEFAERADGVQSIEQQYPGIAFNTLILNAGLLYRAVAEGEVEIISGYSTDGRVKAYDLKVLEDDQHAFPPYQCAALLNGKTALKYPGLRPTIELLSAKISDSLMTRLNYEVDHLHRSVSEVATNFLRQQNLWQAPDGERKGEILIGSKLFTEQYLLVEIFRQLIEGHTSIRVVAKPGLGGTKICYDALRTGEIDIYPEYTGTGFQVLLQPTDSIRNAIFTDADAVYDYVKENCEQKDGIFWLNPLGFNNTYALMTRAVLAKEKGWRKITDLLNN